MFYIRVEAQNLVGTVLDTDKLSVTRGGSLRWREAMVLLEGRLKQSQNIQLKPISTGASIGEFTCEIDASEAISKLLQDEYRELTFAVSASPDRSACELTTRWQQFQQLTVAPERGTAKMVCEFSKIRAGQDTVQAIENGASQPQVGWNVSVRHNFGRMEKQSGYDNEPSNLKRFYRRESGQTKIGALEIDSLVFSNEFSDIAKDAPISALENKLAVFYADGNQFSDFVHGKSDKELADFDVAMGAMRKQLLFELLTWVVGQSEDSKRIPCEVLLWGGDEYTFVLPAWLGWEFTQRFFDATKHWKFPTGTGKSLTHAAGLVFCHYKTPIGRIRDLAKDLADGVKTAAPLQNAFDYLVLESVDFPAQSVNEYWAARVSAAVAAARHPLQPNQAWVVTPLANHPSAALAALKNHPSATLAELKNHQIYRLAQALAKGSTVSFEDAHKRLKRSGIDENQMNAARALFPAASANGIDEDRDKWLWIHLRELRQYLCPTQDKAGAP
jgi:hypothetical protein